MSPCTTAACLLTMTGSVFAQSGVATYSIAFGSPTGPNSIVLAPGESTGVFVNVSFSPGVGSGNPPVAGLSDGAFSISGQGSGTGMWSRDANPASPTYCFPYPWGGQPLSKGPWPGTATSTGVAGVVWGYGFLFSLPHPYPQNPANVYRAKFTAGSGGVISTSFTGLAETGIFAGASGLPSVVSFASQGLGGQITIVPAPAALGVLGLAGALGARRRRSAGLLT